MVNTPIPHSLKSEVKKAAKILREFSIPSAKAGPDKVIPAGLIVRAEGLAILTVVKVGFLVTARGGSGIVVARLPSGEWSPPSAIGIAGLGGGFEIGAEVTDFVIILNKRSAVEAFSKGGNLTLGGNFTIAAGPLGRNLEGDISLRSPAAIYTYSKTKGLFAGISVEGSCLIERKEANRKFYSAEIRACDILSGDVSTPPNCSELYEVLSKHEEMFERALMAHAKKAARQGAEKAVEKSAPGLMSRVKGLKPRRSKTVHKTTSTTTMKASRSTSALSTGSEARQSGLGYAYGSSSEEDVSPPPQAKGRSASQDWPVDGARSSKSKSKSSTSLSKSAEGRQLGMGYAYGSSSSDDESYSPPAKDRMRRAHSMKQVTTTTTTRSVRRKKEAEPPAEAASLSVGRADTTDWDTPPKVRALWPFQGEMPCDLAFDEGDEITVLTRTETEDDWWEGSVHGKTGIFPANYVHLL